MWGGWWGPGVKALSAICMQDSTQYTVHRPTETGSVVLTEEEKKLAGELNH